MEQTTRPRARMAALRASLRVAVAQLRHAVRLALDRRLPPRTGAGGRELAGAHRGRVMRPRAAGAAYMGGAVPAGWTEGARGRVSAATARREAAAHPGQLALFPVPDDGQGELFPWPPAGEAHASARAGDGYGDERPRLELVTGGRDFRTTRPTPGMHSRGRACRPLPDRASRPSAGGPVEGPPVP